MILRHTALREGKLLSFLRRELGLSYGLVKRLKYQDAYHVNGEPAHTDRPIRPGDVITVSIAEAQPDVSPEDGEITILYEDEAIIALDKPPGLLMHPTFNRTQGTLANRLLGYYRRTGQPCAVHLVSRLDRDTFGITLVAKNAHIHALLCASARAGHLEKTYHAAVFGHPPATSGEISLPIARLSPTSLLRCVRADGKFARTTYQVLRTTVDCALVRLRPETGRTHQLRVHCAHEGFPILGDAQYGTDASQAFSQACGYAHQQLCAASLSFPHPLTGGKMVLHSHLSVDV